MEEARLGEFMAAGLVAATPAAAQNPFGRAGGSVIAIGGAVGGTRNAAMGAMVGATTGAAKAAAVRDR